jgi:hypothetical protein
MPTINERMAALGIPGRPYTIADQLDWAAAELDRLEGHFADPTGHGWRNVEPAYTEDGAERDAELSVGVQAEIGYTPPVEDAMDRAVRMGYLKGVHRGTAY